MVETATGLVLRTWPLTETSLIVHWLTHGSGRLATVAKGARRPKSPFRGKLDLFYLADLSFSRSQRSDLHNLREVSLRETYSVLRQELGSLQQACYGAALIEQATERETPLPTLFELMKGLLEHLVVHPPEPQTIFAFELRLLADLGLQPDLAQTRLSAGSKELARILGAADWAAVGRIKPSPGQAAELSRFLHELLAWHLGKVPSSRAAALK